MKKQLGKKPVEPRVMPIREYRCIVRGRTGDGDCELLASLAWDTDETTLSFEEFEAMVVLLAKLYGPDCEIVERQEMPDLVNIDDN